MRYKSLLLSIVAVTGALSLNAKVNAGIEVMPTLADRLSWSVGVNVEVPLSKRTYFSPGLYYSTRLRHYDSEWETFTQGEPENLIYYEKVSADVHSDYLSLPLLIGFKSIRSPRLTIKANFGIYYAWRLGGKSRLKLDDYGEVTQMNVPSYSTFIRSRTDAGLCAEAKFLLFSHYQIGLSLQHGLKKIYEGHSVQGIRDSHMFHRVGPGIRFHQSIGLSVGYLF